MDCRQFRKQHTFFIDDMLSGVATWAMRDHLGSCASCSKLDSQLRRSLLVVRQAPTLELSKDFHRRLSARLAAEKLAHPAFLQVTAPRSRRAPILAAAAAFLVFGIGGYRIVNQASATPMSQLPAVVATSAPEQVPAMSGPIARPAAQPVHPAILLAQRATEQFAEAQARAAALRATH